MDEQPPDVEPATAPFELPRAVRLLERKLGPAWRHRIIRGQGVTEVTSLGDERSDGTRPRVTIVVPVLSVSLRAARTDAHRAVGVWICRDGKWSFDQAWSWARGELPRQVNARALAELVATDVPGAPAAEQLALDADVSRETRAVA